VVMTLLRLLPRERFELHLALVIHAGPFLADVPEDVQVHDLGAGRVRKALRPLIALSRRLEPDVLFSTFYHLNQLLLAARPLLPRRTRVIVREATILGESLRGPRSAGFRLLTRWLYPTADRIVSQSRFMADDLALGFRVPRSKLVTIYNPLDVEAARARAGSGGNPFADRGLGPHVVAAGRIHPVKGFDDLIRALPALRATRPDAIRSAT